ncbi:MAG: enoyl-CoA hydratase-related protein, partial [Desemzia incerta]
YTAKTINANEAMTIGLLNQIAEPADLIEEAEKMAQAIMKQSPLAVEASKKAINRGYEMDLVHGLEMEAEMFGALFATEDQKEGMTAFTEKRKAAFKRK